MMDATTEISIQIDGQWDVEYYANVIPRVGEILDINVEHTKGLFVVTEVRHKLFDTKKEKNLYYVKIKAETVR